ncbi:protein BONZAI 3-like isoform X1 [Pyrus communis]|uniref:protein BONZAI 3-like isoform X1 n=1 Tax=Pyrus communis TaxID=23211 RepID=UPI0035C22407
MGGCFSDVRGGKDAVGGDLPRPTEPNAKNDGAHNDAIELFYRAHGAYPLFTQLELSFSASKLLNLDVTSKSDPMVIVYLKKNDGKLEELGRTEVILNNLNPVWIQKVSVAYQFEMVQNLIFRVYDVDTQYHNVPVKTLNLKDQEFLGEGSCVLSEIVTKQNRSLTLTLKGKNGHGGLRNFGTLTVHAEETIASRSAVEIKFRCAHLDNKDLFSKSVCISKKLRGIILLVYTSFFLILYDSSLQDPFLRISRTVETGGSIPICKTEVVDNNLNPTWKPLCLSMQQFGSKDNPLVIECFDFNSDGNHILIGKLQKSVADLEKLFKEKSGVNFFIPSSRAGHEKVLKGQLFVDQFCEKEQFSFVDYISSGFELNFMVAVDFTGSNGDPRKPESLHYIDPYGRLNSYQQAITEVGQVIQFYDADKSFPALGFGGRTANGTVSHCFNLNGNASESEVVGVEGIMAAYANALRNVALSGPTLFGQVVNRAAEIAARSLSSNNNKYYVLLIITDGILTDLQETKDALVRASNLPLSILIVGVGNADFKQMEILDADNGQRLESSTGRIATRDIVQFVPMRDVQSGQISVVQGLLEELPGQFLSYMRSMDIKPLTFNAAAQASRALEIL